MMQGIDWQAVINIAIPLATSVFGWLLRTVWQANKELRDDMKVLRESLPATYVRRDDFKDHARRIEDVLTRIEIKLDAKADRA
jgi:hypothetical protein